jgi:predicted DNA-binding transcriptional regulator YafY
MRADRLLSMLMLLQVRRRMTARELAERLECSERTVYRDLDALSAAGVPMYAQRGAGGGCLLPDGYRTNLTGLNEPEVQALVLAAPARVLADLGLRQAGEAALLKLLAALPASAQRGAAEARGRIHVDAAGWTRPEEAALHLPSLLDAIWQERKVRLCYRRSEGAEPFERVVDPLGLVAKGSVWYLVAGVEGDVRTYRVSRVVEAVVSDEPAARPEGFDLAAHWGASSEQFVRNIPQFRATLRVRSELLGRLRGFWRYARIEHEDEPVDGWARLEVSFDGDLEAAFRDVLPFAPDVVVLEPTELRARVLEAARELAALHAETHDEPWTSRPQVARAVAPRRSGPPATPA